MADTHLAYLVSRADDARASYVGAVMVTDAIGLPVEFRFTQPIRPTKLHRVLYGSTMDPYIKRDVIAARLMSDLETRPAIVIVQDAALLPLDERIQAPLVQVFSTKLDALGSLGASDAVDETSFLLQLADGAGPVRITLHRPDASRQSTVCELLTRVASAMDVCEPLTRVEEAIALVCEDAQNS